MRVGLEQRHVRGNNVVEALPVYRMSTRVPSVLTCSDGFPMLAEAIPVRQDEDRICFNARENERSQGRMHYGFAI